MSKTLFQNERKLGSGEQGVAEILNESPEFSFEFFEDFEIDSQGRIVAAGTETVTRFSAAGQLDTSFGDDGVAFLPNSLVENGVTQFGIQLNNLAIDNQGRILLVTNSGLLALNSDGLAPMFHSWGGKAQFSNMKKRDFSQNGFPNFVFRGCWPKLRICESGFDL